MEWTLENNGLKRKRQDFDFLLIKPTFHMYKIKFQKVLLNATMTAGLDSNHFIFYNSKWEYICVGNSPGWFTRIRV